MEANNEVMNEQASFAFSIISENEPLSKDAFYAWLSEDENNPRIKGNQREHMILCYLESLGFIKGEDKITEKELQILQYIEEHWHRTFPRLPSSKFSDLFPVPDSEHGYYVAGNVKGKLHNKYLLGKDLILAINETGMIYRLSPENYYFEIINGNLFIKYQQILGSRFICNII